MNEKNVKVKVVYILKSGEQIDIKDIDKLRHRFPLGLIDGEPLKRAIVNVIDRAEVNFNAILEIHENGEIRDNLS